MGTGVDRKVEEIRRLMEDRLRIRGRDLAHQTRRAGRLLPRRIRGDLSYVEQAQRLLNHPKLHLMVDEEKVNAAHARIAEHLKTVDPVEARKTRLLGIAAGVTFNLIVVFALLMAVLAWQGYL